MNGFWGADTEALRTMGAVCARRADALSDLERMLSSTIENLEWIGEDADRFRAEWSGVVRSGLQDQEVELRHRARRLAQHADEQEEASSPDGPVLGGGGGWTSPGAFLREVVDLTGSVLDGLLGRDGGAGGQDGPLAALLREVLSTPEGRAAFLGAFLGTLLGGLLAEMVSRAIGLGTALQDLLPGLGVAGGLSTLIGESTLVPAVGADEPAAAQSGATSGDASGADGAASVGEPGGGSGAESGGGSGTGGGSGGGESGAGADGAGGAEAGQDGPAAAGATGPRATEAGAGQTLGSSSGDRIQVQGDEGPRSLLERLLDMLGDAIDSGAVGGAAIGDEIGSAGLGGPRR
jgi:hypothetical protein